METLRIYGLLVAIAVRARMQYRSDFLVGVVGVVVLNSTNLAMIWVLLNRFHALQGWNYWEIVMLYGMWLASHSIYAVFFWHLGYLEDEILSGRFDRFLIRPIGPLVQFLGREINYMGSGDIMVAVTVLTLAYRNLGLHWSSTEWLFFAFMLLCGVTIETSIVWIFGTLSFWTGRSTALFRVALRFNLLTQQYPIDIFGRWYQIFVTGFFPVAFVNYYPLTVLLGKRNALELQPLGYLSPVVAVVLPAPAYRFWLRGLRQYSSTGS